MPPDEAGRLATLRGYHILDTPRDDHIDALTRLAARLFDMPYAAVSLTDARRQWIKSEVGGLSAAAGFAKGGFPRDGSFSAYAINEPDGRMVVEDATADPRFAASPLVTGPPRLRFYAGAALRDRTGHALGTVSVMDRVPRTLPEHGLQSLADLAAGIVSAFELHRNLVQMRDMAERDPLTGLVNRRTLEIAARKAVDASDEGRHCAVLCLDLDRLKIVNDMYGHAAGDLLIREASRRLRASVRDGDLVARLGGDEFAVLMTDLEPSLGPEALADRLIDALAVPFQFGDHTIPIRASVGIASCPQDAGDVVELLRCADAALYRAKRDGRGRHCRYEPAMAHELLAQRSLESDLRAAVRDDAFKLHWQPIADARTLVVTGFEALLRWDRPEVGPTKPAEFIPVAEACGLVVGIDHWVLRTACAAAARWPQPFRLAVNVSPETIRRGGLSVLVADVLRDSGLDPRRLELEITERTVLEYTGVSREEIARLKAMGVRLSLDDFGTGYSSLGYLEAFSLDKLKLDRSFVSGLGRRPRTEAITRNILQLGEALGMVTCAEGVETQEQLGFLRRHGCHEVQGHLIGYPVPENRAMFVARAARVAAASAT